MGGDDCRGWLRDLRVSEIDSRHGAIRQAFVVLGMSRTLVAGIGNIFLSDDGFGVEVVRRLAKERLPDSVEVRDFGIRALHLAYELVDGNYETTILIDAAPRGGSPGTVYLIEPALDGVPEAPAADAHAMSFEAVLAMQRMLGGAPGRILVLGCEPLSVEEGMALSEPVAAAVDEAVALIHELVAREVQCV